MAAAEDRPSTGQSTFQREDSITKSNIDSSPKASGDDSATRVARSKKMDKDSSVISRASILWYSLPRWDGHHHACCNGD